MTDINKLVEVMSKLRGNDGCPWDKEQTFDTLKRFMVEEVYEVIEAINKNDNNSIKEELGDLLLQVVFYSEIAREKSLFNFQDVIDGIHNKLIQRHPHIFRTDSEKIITAKQVEEQWESIKVKTNKKSVIDGVPKSMPSTLQALRITEKASRVGFDWDNSKQVISKIYEEIKELEEAIESKNNFEITNELGDVFFALSNLARKLNINPEEAHLASINKFSNRFKKMEELAKDDGKNFYKLLIEEQELYWIKAKKVLE